MPFRAIPKPSEKKDQANQPIQTVPEKGGFWRTSFLLITSAACGGIAVAIWNRRTLALMRAQAAGTDNPPVSEK